MFVLYFLAVILYNEKNAGKQGGIMDRFVLHSDFKPMGDQPQAIEELVEGFKKVKHLQWRTLYRMFRNLHLL